MKDEEVERKILEVIDALDGSSRKWIGEFAKRHGLDYDSLMKAAENFILYGEVTEDPTPDNSAAWSSEGYVEFWNRYERLTGKKLTTNQTDFFECNC